MDVQVWTQAIHEMDHNGSLQFDVTHDGHTLSYRQWWENCGLTGETFECSCGFHSTEHQGNGCWQHGHDVGQFHAIISSRHAAMILSALEKAQASDLSYPAHLRALAMLAIRALGKRQGSMALLKRAMRIA